MNTIGKIFLESATKRLNYYKELGEKTFAQLSENDFHFMPEEESNNIAIIIQHMHGNMLSRWTDLLTTDGEKGWRERDREFEDQNLTKEQLMDRWQKGWQCFYDALKPLSEEDLTKTIFIRDEPLSVIDAINRQLAHYPYHVGQIIYAAKILKNKDWQNLSVPKDQSGLVNELKSNP
jgi:hypothetical protein